MIYKIWECIFGNRLTPLKNRQTDEAQTAYKANRSTTDVLSLIVNGAKQSAANQLILIARSKAFGSTERRTQRAARYEKGMPRAYIRAIQKGHSGTQLRPKIDGQLGKSIDNRGASQGAH